MMLLKNLLKEHLNGDYRNGQGLVLSEEGGERIFNVDLLNKKLILDFEYDSYIPAAVYKGFVKMGLSLVLEDELLAFQGAIKWILCADHSKEIMRPLLIHSMFIPGVNPNKTLHTFFLTKKEDVRNESLPYSFWLFKVLNG